VVWDYILLVLELTRGLRIQRKVKAGSTHGIHEQKKAVSSLDKVN
jgi:hypothetical protein